MTTTVTVVFSEDVYGTVDADTFILKNGSTVIPGSITYEALSRTAIFTPTGMLASGTTYTVELTSGIKDLSGNSLSYYTSSFTTAVSVDVIAPVVISINPADGAVNPPITSTVTAKFSEPLDSNTVNEDTFVLMNGSSRIYGSVHYDSSLYAATFTPDSALDNNVIYTVILSTGIKDLSGNSLAEVFNSTFTVLSTPASPTVKSVNTGNGGEIFPVDGSITVEFSEAMNPDSINTNTFIVFNGNSAVSGTVSYDASTNKAIFTPDNPLNYTTSYTVNLTTGISSASGVSLTDDITWAFTTVNPPDVTAPTVMSVDPADGVSNPPAASAVTVRFSEPMNGTTINTDTFMLMNGSAVISGTVIYNSLLREAIFTPVSALWNNVYTVKLTTGIKDISGNSLASEFKSTFTIVSTGTNPAVKAVNTGTGGADFPIDGAITVEFNVPMDPGSININTFIITDENSAISGLVSYDLLTNTAIFMPYHPLNYNTTYTVDLTTDIKNVKGESLAAYYIWK